MEIDIIKRETTGTGPNVYHENDTIAKYEIMDGAPVRGTEQWAKLNPSQIWKYLLPVLQLILLLVIFCP